MIDTIINTLTTHITNQLQQHDYLIEHNKTAIMAHLNGQNYSSIKAHKYQTINLQKHIMIFIYQSINTQTDLNIQILTEYSRSKNNKIFTHKPPKLRLNIQAHNPNLLEQIEQQIKQ